MRHTKVLVKICSTHEGNFSHKSLTETAGMPHRYCTSSWVLQVYLTGTEDVPHMDYGFTTWVQHNLSGTKNAFHRVRSENLI